MGKFDALVNTAGRNAGQNYYAHMMPVESITTDMSLAQIFPIREENLNDITESIRKDGYDKSQPIVIDRETKAVIDGHTRLAAAKKAELNEIPVVERSFASKEEAILYCYNRQLQRRNLTPAEIFTAVQTLEGKRSEYGKGRGAENLAKQLGVGSATVFRAKKILNEASEENIEAVRNGDKTIGEVYKEIKKTKPKPETKIEAEPELVEMLDDENEIEVPATDEFSGEYTGIDDVLRDIGNIKELINSKDFNEFTRHETELLLSRVERFLNGGAVTN
jgi:ParB family chromosome partitioning protein